jgi:two-component system OmpR family sensor kinase
MAAGRRWPLTRTLVAWTVALFFVVTAATGAATLLVMNRVLTRQVDTQVLAISNVQQNRNGARPGPGPGNRGNPPPGTGEGYVHLEISNTGAVIENYVVQEGSTAAALDEAQLQAVTTKAEGPAPRTVDLGEYGRYRVVRDARPVWVRTGAGLRRQQVTSYSGLPLAGARTAVLDTLRYVVALSGLGLLLTAVAGTWLVRRSLRPLRRVASTAHEVSQLQLESGQVALAPRVPEADTDTRTEVGQVGTALNRMLDNVGDALNARHASEQRVRQFVADASHELRTPLASIRGYAEYSLRQRSELSEPVAHALTRVQSEADRLTELVEDLLLLARLDAGRPLEREHVDLSQLVVEAVADARVAGPDHVWALDVPARPIETEGDQRRLQQVLVNLLANARVHTPPGTTVLVSLSQLDGCPRLQVTDDGPGIPTDLQPEVFTRFARGDTSRNRAAGSTGLGLSIVAAVVAAHRGQVQMDSVPGRTTFTVTLPPSVVGTAH